MNRQIRTSTDQCLHFSIRNPTDYFINKLIRKKRGKFSLILYHVCRVIETCQIWELRCLWISKFCSSLEMWNSHSIHLLHTLSTVSECVCSSLSLPIFRLCVLAGWINFLRLMRKSHQFSWKIITKDYKWYIVCDCFHLRCFSINYPDYAETGLTEDNLVYRSPGWADKQTKKIAMIILVG